MHHDHLSKLTELIHAQDAPQLEKYLDSLSPTEVAWAFAHMDKDMQANALVLISPEEAADLMEEVSDIQAASLIEEVLEEHSAETAAAIVDEMRSDEQADVLAELDDVDSRAILAEMDPEDAESAREIMTYPDNTAGAIMIREFLAYGSDLTVTNVISDLRMHAGKYAAYDIQYLYVTSASGGLTGILNIRDVLLHVQDDKLEDVMRPDPRSVQLDHTLEELQEFFGQHNYYGAPVVDEENRLIGVVRRSEVYKAAEEKAEKKFLATSGIVGGEEVRSMDLHTRAFRRLSWLSINIFLNILAALVIVFYQDTIKEAIALAVFLPIISDMSGCSGNQAAAVSIRELSLGLVKPHELLSVCMKEIGVGLLNGTVLGCLLGLVAWLWQGNPFLGLVVGGALALNTVVAVLLGGTVPLVLRYLKRDPAVAAGPIMTTVTDMCGFFFLLYFATVLLEKLK